MSPLPQRKKSAEEIAKLRESLGVPALHDADEETPVAASPDTLIPTHHEAAVVHLDPAPAPETIVAHNHKATVVDHPAPPQPGKPEPPAKHDPKPVPHLPKPVRSLRKSEQIPVLVPAPAKPAATSKLPIHRHSDEEIAEIRRREALALMNPAPPNPKLAAAHPVLLISGYLFALAGATCFVHPDFPMAATAGCTTAALLIATFVFARRPLSRHHAGFIAVIALFVLVFGTLHYFPQLRHAT